MFVDYGLERKINSGLELRLLRGGLPFNQDTKVGLIRQPQLGQDGFHIKSLAEYSPLISVPLFFYVFMRLSLGLNQAHVPGVFHPFCFNI